VAGETFFVLTDGFNDLAIFGVADDHLLISTHEDHITDLLGGGTKLSDTDRFARMAATLPGAPLFYVDVPGLLAALEVPADEAVGLAPLQAVAGSLSRERGITRFTMMALIDY